jgi:hypothetical protein
MSAMGFTCGSCCVSLLQAMQHLAAARAGLATMVRIDHVRCPPNLNRLSGLCSLLRE